MYAFAALSRLALPQGICYMSNYAYHPVRYRPRAISLTGPRAISTCTHAMPSCQEPPQGNHTNQPQGSLRMAAVPCYPVRLRLRAIAARLPPSPASTCQAMPPAAGDVCTLSADPQDSTTAPSTSPSVVTSISPSKQLTSAGIAASVHKCPASPRRQRHHRPPSDDAIRGNLRIISARQPPPDVATPTYSNNGNPTPASCGTRYSPPASKYHATSGNLYLSDYIDRHNAPGPSISAVLRLH